jgi:hypothetical protein
MKRIPFKYNDQLKQIAREDLFSLSNVLETIAFLFKTLKILHILLVVICEYCKVCNRDRSRTKSRNKNGPRTEC